MKNILLVYPEVPKNTFWSYKYALSLVGKKSAMPPLGLITLAALFPRRYELKLVDMNIEPLKEKDIQWADAVFVSAMIVQKTSLGEVISLCSRLKTPVVAGGPYPTSSHKEIQGVDHFVLGEVEDVFLKILDDLESGSGKKVYSPSHHPDLSRSIVPRFDLLNLKAYASMAVQYSRGCPFKCEFCDIWAVYGNRSRVKQTSHFLSELDALYDLGWRGSVFIVDDNFIGNKHRVKKDLLPSLIQWHKAHGYPFRFFTEASINMASDEMLLSLMRDAGFNEVFIGIETPSAEALKETHKTQNLKIDMSQAIRIIQEYGIGVMAGFILGFDNDGDDIFDRQIEFIQKSAIPRAMVGLLTALPGTQLYARLENEGRLTRITEGNNTHNMETNFVTKMESTKLKEGYKKILSTIYDSNLKNYFSRCNTLLDNLGQTPFYQRDIYFNELKIFFKSLFRQPFTSYGFQYVKFVLRTLVRRPESISEAIALSIAGHHYHTITQETLKVEKVTLALEENYVYLREQLNTYRLGIQNNYREGIRNIVRLWEQKSHLLEDVGKKIDKIHIDFRKDISRNYYDMADRMRGLFTGFEKDLARHGIGI